MKIIQEMFADQLSVRAFDTRADMGECAGTEAAEAIRRVIAEKGVNIPLATNTTVGVIKGSDVENGVVIDEQGAASVKNLNVGKLVQTDGDWLILNGGNSTLTVE